MNSRNKRRHAILIKAVWLLIIASLILHCNPSTAVPDLSASDLRKAEPYPPAYILNTKSNPIRMEPHLFEAVKTALNPEQLRNYIAEHERIVRIVDLIYKDITAEQKRCWLLLLIGTVAVESNFLDRYSGRSFNGNGPYQITADTAYGIVHSYVTYALKGRRGIGKREGLIPFFEEATDGRITWDQLIKMNRSQLIELCVRDYDFSALLSLLVYKEAFERNSIEALPSNPEDLGRLWKQYYNTHLGVGTVERFIERFNTIYRPLPKRTRILD